jgi:hypothetical protein
MTLVMHNQKTFHAVARRPRLEVRRALEETTAGHMMSLYIEVHTQSVVNQQLVGLEIAVRTDLRLEVIPRDRWDLLKRWKDQ